MAKKDKNDPSVTSDAYDEMAPKWNMVESLLGGTLAMRAAGEKYLPRHPAETDEGYQNRLTRAVLLNAFEDAVGKLSGKPFSEPMKLNDDVPPEIVNTVVPDVDLQGNALDVFCRNWFREGLAKALCHVLVEFPKPRERAPDAPPRTLADDRAEGLRPYWVMIKPENVLFARAEIEDGREVLKHIRILECFTAQDGFVEVQKHRIRVLEPGLVQIWEPDRKPGPGAKTTWNKTDEWVTGREDIPLVTFYAHREDLMLGRPPLENLAHLNVAHWQSDADQRHCLTVARFPLLACSGASKDDSDPIVVGPDKVLYNTDPAGRFYYVEHTGAAIAAGRNDLLDLQEQMAAYGAELLRKKPGTETATGRAIDSAESSSDLAAMAVVFEDAVAQALQKTAEWMNLPEGGTVEVVKDYGPGEADAAGLTALHNARTTRNISRETYLDGLRLRGVLPDDFDAEEDAASLEKEAEDLMKITGASELDLDPGAKDPKKGGPDDGEE